MFKKFRTQKEIIDFYIKENEELIAINKELEKRLRVEREIYKTGNLAVKEKEVEKLKEEYEQLICETKKIQKEYKEKIQQVKELKKDYQKEMDGIIKSVKSGLK